MTALAATLGTDEWVRERQKHIVASDVPVILGLIPYEQQIDDVEVVTVGCRDALEYRAITGFGSNGLKELIKALYSEESMNEVFSASMYEHIEYQWMSAEPDGWVEDDNGEYIFECKAVAGDATRCWDRNSGELTLPLTYWVEVQHSMEVSCADKAIVCVLKGSTGIFELLGNILNSGADIEYVKRLCQKTASISLEVIEVERDKKFIKKLLNVEEEFWEELQEGTVLRSTKDVKNCCKETVVGRVITELCVLNTERAITKNEYDLYAERIGKLLKIGTRQGREACERIGDLLGIYARYSEQKGCTPISSVKSV